MSNPNSLEEVAQSFRQWTGIAVMRGMRDRRIFVNFPRWSADVPVSVAELLPYGAVCPFPNSEWNEWHGGGEGAEPRFVCVQSVVADKDGDHLWVLDSGNPCFTGVIPGAARLLKFNIQNGQLISEIAYKKPDICHHSYLNDVRIDTTNRIAYLTDSEEGAIIVTDLESRESRRLLDGHCSVESEGIDVVIDGAPWRQRCGVRPRVHVDGIALSPKNDILYFHALTGQTLYQVPTADLQAALRNPTLTPKVQWAANTGPADGMECAPDDDGTLYLTSLEDHAVKRLKDDGTVEVVAQDHRLQWPDSLAVGPDGYIYVTTSRIHLGTGPYSVFRFKP